MTKRLAGWVSGTWMVVGLVLIGAFFAPWGPASGWTFAGEMPLLFVVPLFGAVLAIAAGLRSPRTRVIALVPAALVAIGVAYNLASALWSYDSLVDSGTSMMCCGAIAMLIGAATRRRGITAAGGLAIMVLFFAPWTTASLFHALYTNPDAMMPALGTGVKVLWLLPVAGLAALASSVTTKRTVPVVAGVATIATLLYVITNGLADLAWGGWLTIAAGTTAVALGLLAPAEKA